jgi:hypothetical protein
MNIKITHAWMESGSPPIDDLASISGLGSVYLIKIFQGTKYPDLGTQQLLANIFKKKVSDLFDDLPG